MKKQVTKSRFLSWYFSDTFDAHCIGCDVISALKNDGEFIITTQDLLDRCGYIPSWLCEGEDNKSRDLETDKVELING